MAKVPSEEVPKTLKSEHFRNEVNNFQLGEESIYLRFEYGAVFEEGDIIAPKMNPEAHFRVLGRSNQYNELELPADCKVDMRWFMREHLWHKVLNTK